MKYVTQSKCIIFNFSEIHKHRRRRSRQSAHTAPRLFTPSTSKHRQSVEAPLQSGWAHNLQQQPSDDRSQSLSGSLLVARPSPPKKTRTSRSSQDFNLSHRSSFCSKHSNQPSSQHPTRPPFTPTPSGDKRITVCQRLLTLDQVVGWVGIFWKVWHQ